MFIFLCCTYSTPHSLKYVLRPLCSGISFPEDYFIDVVYVSVCAFFLVFFSKVFFFSTNTASLYFCLQPFPFKAERKAAVMPYDQRATARATSLCGAAAVISALLNRKTVRKKNIYIYIYCRPLLMNKQLSAVNSGDPRPPSLNICL